MFGSDRDPVGGVFVNAVDAWCNAMADLAAGNRRQFAGPGEPVGSDQLSGGRRNSVSAEFVVPMGQAVMIAANRSVSYWLNLAQILGNYQAKSIQTLGGDESGGAAAAQRLAVDDLRGLLREVGDLATREARLLQSEFGSLAESVAQNIQPSDQPGAYQRRWRSKI